jgi:predicted nucleic acid-binding protein
MVIVDSTVWIDYLAGVVNPHTVWLEQEMGRQRLGLTDLILCEVLQGIRRDSVMLSVRRDLLRFEVFATGGTDLALAAAENYRNLRKLGFTVRKTIDCWIATFCLENGHYLLHRDHDFDPFEEHLRLMVVDPSV